MTTLTKTDLIGELASIKNNIDRQITDLHTQMESARAQLAHFQAEQAQLSEQKDQHAGQSAKHQATISTTLAPILAARDRELQAAKGSSLQKELQGAYRAAKKDVDDVQAAITLLARQIDAIDNAEQSNDEQIAALAATLKTLADKEQEVLSTRATFDTRHSAAVLEECKTQLAATANDVARAEQALASARESHQATQQEVAQRLAEWPTLATDFLVAHGDFAEEHPEVELLRLKARLVALAEQHASTLGDRMERALNFNVPLQALARDGGRSGFQEKREDSARRYQATFGQEMAAIDGYHNSAIESFAVNCDALTVMLAQAEADRKVEQAKSLLGESSKGPQ